MVRFPAARLLGLALMLCSATGPGAAWAQDRSESAPTSADDARERQAMERFLSLLERSPRRGTALDRVYGYHVEHGTLDAFLKTYQDRVNKNGQDGTGWLLLGLLEAQRGRDAAAVAALKKAEETRPDDPLPSYYLGQALVLVGQPDAAAEAFERAISRKPPRTDVLEVFQALGRVHQRAHRNSQALAVWKRLEALFPDDLRVQEQIASTLAEESQYAQALERYEALARKVRDNYRQVQFRMEAADLKVRLGQSREALKDLENLLGQLNPDSWLHKEVRRKIEDVFLRNDDQAGLAKYYEAWIGRSPEDVDAMARLGRTLAIQGRVAESQKWFDQAVKLAPARKELRLALVEQLVHDKKFALAAAQYEALSKNDPNNPDYVREWGRLLLRDTARPEPDRKQAAAAVWRRLLEARPKDPATATQVADLFRQAGMVEQAVALYKKAIELAPDAPQYREYLGEFYHQAKRPAEALATWQAIASGKNRTAKNLARLAEVLAGFGYRQEAVAAIAQACELDPESFEPHLKYADLLYDVERFADADKQLEITARLTTDADEAETVLDRQIRNDQAAGTLAGRIETMQQRLNAGQGASATSWRRLARYLEAGHQLPEATAAIRKALELDTRSVPAWSTAARLFESSGSLQDAADAYRKLAGLDRRSRTDYLTSVAKIEARLGRHDAALKAGRELLSAAPNNPEHYQFFAELCFQLGDLDEGFDALRRAARINDADPRALLALADALAKQFRTEEAIELFWRAFEKTQELDGKLGLVARLTELYLQRNQFDRLIARLERLGREQNQQRELALCRAQAYTSSGDYGTARQELERLLATNTRDTQLLQQLAALSENEGDAATAAKYLRQLTEIAPSDDGLARLAQLSLRAGETAEAEAIWSRLAGAEKEPHRILHAIDSLLAHGKPEAVLGITERLLREKPGNWEALYREARALTALDRQDEAARRYQAILDLHSSDDEPGALVQARKRMPRGTIQAPGAPSLMVMQPYRTATFPIQDRVNAVYQIRSESGLQPAAYYGGGMGYQVTWSPEDFGQARMVALAWLFNRAQRESAHEAWLKTLREACTRAPNDPRPHWDLYYVQLVRQEYREMFRAAQALVQAAGTDPSAAWVDLYSVPNRTIVPGQVSYRPQGEGVVDKTPPLPPAELDHLLACARMLLREKPNWLQAQMLTGVTTELKRAQRTEDADRFYHDLIAAATDADGVSHALPIASERADLPALFQLLERYQRLQAGRSLTKSAVNPYSANANPADALARAMAERGTAKAYGDVLSILDHYLDYVRHPDQVAQRTRSRTGNFAFQNMGNTNYQIYLGKTPRWIQVEYPQPGLYYDNGAIQLLRNAFEIYKRDDLVSDLAAHLRKPLEPGSRSSDADKLYAHLNSSALQWWSDERDLALDEMSLAAGLAPSDFDLRLNLAEIRAQRNETDEALALVDSVEPLDQKTMQRREILALRLSVQTGDVERARQAAERLFGLRLDSNTQVQLAGQMHQLGMHELAEAVLARARRRAGNNTGVLVSLMSQYQRQGKTDVAVQVAHQILRRTPNRQYTPYNDGDYAQREAIQVLARSGKLKEMMDRVKAQLEHSPNSVQLLQSLADYYRAAGDRDQVKALYKRIAEARPDDARLRYQLAMQLVQSGEAAAALDHYKAALKKEPGLFANQYWEIQNAFQAANKLDDLYALLEQIDVKSMGNYWSVANVIQQMMQNEKTRDRGLALFRKAWKAFPNERQWLISNLHDEQIWKLPEIFDYACQAILPAPAQTEIAPWSGIEQISMWDGEGRATGVATRMLDAAARQNKLDSIADQLQEALKRLPEWSGGQALLAIVQLRRGRVAEAQKKLQALLDEEQRTKVPISPYARLIIGQELENYGPMQPIALALYEASVRDQAFDESVQFRIHPAHRLMRMYQRAGRLEDAREVVQRFAKHGSNRYANYDPQYAAHQRVNDLTELGQQYLELGFAGDALQMFNTILQEGDQLKAGNRYFGNADYLLQRASDGINRALQNQSGDSLERTLRAILKPAETAAPGAPVLALGVLVNPRQLDKANVTSLFATAIGAVAAKTELHDHVASLLAELVKAHPDDLSVLTGAALFACAEGKAAAIQAAASRLAEQVEKVPLEPLPPGTRANARQREAAAAQLGLWLVARECWKHEETRELGDRLAERALAAARRQADGIWPLAMLREWGQLALDRGDRATAEKRWTEMLDLVLAADAAKKKPRTARPAPAAPGPPARSTRRTVKPVSQVAPPPPAPASPAPPATVAIRHDGSPIITIDRFDQAMDLAKLAANHGMLALSLRAVRGALEGGAPMALVQLNQNPGMIVRSTSIGSDPQQEQATQRVEQRLAELEPLWLRQHAPAREIYETLREAVLPASRPTEVFLYPRSLTRGSAYGPSGASSLSSFLHPRSVSSMLARWAVRAGAADDLAARIDARAKQPLAEFPALVLQAQLAGEQKSSARLKEVLANLGTHIAKDTLQTSAELACHAALPCLRDSDTEQAALPVIEQAIKNLDGQPAEEPVGSLHLGIARFLFDRQQVAAARKHLQDYMAAMDRSTVRYGGDYSVYRRKLNYQRVAAEYARAGRWADALETLGQFVDAPQYSGGDPALGFEMAAIARQMGALPARDRYNALKRWTMPESNRKSIRALATYVTSEAPPPVFGITVPAAAASGLISTLETLIEAARAAGTLDELAQEARNLADQKIENAQALLVLVELARGRGKAAEPIARSLAAELTKRIPAPPEESAAPRPVYTRPRAIDWADLLVTRACLRDPVLGALGESMAGDLITHAERTLNMSALIRLRVDLAAHRASLAAGSAPRPDRNPGLALWDPASHLNAISFGTGQNAAWWLESEGMVSHLAGPQDDFLYFAYPLEGSFAFSVDAYNAAWAEGHVAYAGITFEPMTSSQPSQVWLAGRSETLNRPCPFLSRDAFQRLTVQVEPGKVRCLVNGHLFYENNDASRANPWLALYAASSRQTVFRNFRLEGSPRIPREVRLVAGDRLDGWISSYYYESQPARSSLGPTTSTYMRPRVTDSGEPDWSASDGTILGRLRDASTEAELAQSLLYYHRPIRDGETVSYEFYYEPGSTVIHPALGRMAFLLSPEGVRLHWMTSDADTDWTGLRADNAVDDPASHRGPDRLPLRPGQWNAVRVGIEQGKVQIALNDQPVCERAIEPAQSTLFGLYRDKNRHAAQVRNVVLKGDWPESLSAGQLASLTGVQAHTAAGSPRVRAALVGEAFLSLQASEVLRQARAVPPGPRFDRLAAWVLPGEDHAGFRLYGGFTSADLAPILASDESSAESRPRQHTGGLLEAPALELTAVARELGKLDDLAQRVEETEAATEHDKRGRLAMLALVRIAQERDSDAETLLRQIQTRVDAMPADVPRWERWPEQLAQWLALTRPKLAGPAQALAERLVAQAERCARDKIEFPDRRNWHRQVQNGLARAEVLSQAPAGGQPFGRDPKLAGWAVVERASATARAEGAPRTAWTVRDGALRHQPGHDHDLVYFRAPIRGNFELSCELNALGTDQVEVAYGALMANLEADRKNVLLSDYGSNPRRLDLTPPLDDPKGWYTFRIVVQDGDCRYYVNDRKVDEERLPADPDPWLALHQSALGRGAVRNLKLTGQPTIPDRIALSAGADMTGWLADYYDEPLTGTDAAWEKRGEELFARAYAEKSGETDPRYFPVNPNVASRAYTLGLPGSKQESLLRYHRPLLEDGEVEYEFYYVPGKVLAHPALDRLVFLLEADGVKVHWLTDGPADRSGLSPANAALEPAHRRGPASLPLKARDWNRVTLKLAGDVVTLTLNDVTIFERPLEPSNQRFFGLFHYADETEVRVRNVVHRGSWPRTLPEVSFIASP